MKIFGRALGALALTACLAWPSAPLLAQSAVMTTDHAARASKLVGAPVYNAQGEQIGTLDDVLIPADGGAASAVVSVGAHLGGGEKMVLVPLSHVRFHGDRATMTATKAQLAAMKPFVYHMAADSSG